MNAKRTPWRLLAQLAVSAALIALLIALARNSDLAAGLRGIDATAVLLAVGVLILSACLSSWRWQRLLAAGGTVEGLPRLIGLYFSGMFCSLFLPSSVGGDALRIVELSRRGWSTLRVALATFQERLIGLMVTMLIGLAATLAYLDLLPSAFSVSVIALQLGALVAVAVLLNPARLFGVAARLGRHRLLPARLRALEKSPRFQRLAERLRPLREMPPLPWRDLVPISVVAAVSFLFYTAMCPILGSRIGIDLSMGAYCLVVPLVWIVRLLPVSFNGVGVGEGAFVFLTGLFGVPAGKALALALALLAVQTLVALFGGVVLLGRITFAARKPKQVERRDEQPERRAA